MQKELNNILAQVDKEWEKEFECSCSGDLLDDVTCLCHGVEAKKYKDFIHSKIKVAFKAGKKEDGELKPKPIYWG